MTRPLPYLRLDDAQLRLLRDSLALLDFATKRTIARPPRSVVTYILASIIVGLGVPEGLTTDEDLFACIVAARRLHPSDLPAAHVEMTRLRRSLEETADATSHS